MNMVKIREHENLQKDLDSGAILLTPSNNSVEIRLSNLSLKLKNLEEQNKEIIELLKLISTKI